MTISKEEKENSHWGQLAFTAAYSLFLTDWYLLTTDFAYICEIICICVLSGKIGKGLLSTSYYNTGDSVKSYEGYKGE